MEKKNEKTKIILGLGVIVGIIVLSYILFPGGYKRLSAPPERAEDWGEHYPLEEPQGIRTVSDIIEQETDSYIINIRYVIVEGLEDQGKQANLNEKIKDFATQPMADFKTQTEEFEIFEDMKSGLYLEPQVTYLSEELISIRFGASEYYSGAAHPNNYTLVFNYDITQDKEIVLNDLFLPDADYLSLLSNLTRTALFERFEDDLGSMEDWIESGTKAKEENFQNFSFTEDTLVIYFDPYQVGPYALGIQTIEILFKDLEEYIDPEGPLKGRF